MFIYRLWALFVIASLSAASTSTKLGKLKSKKEIPTLQHAASQPITASSPGSPIALHASASHEQIKLVNLSTSAPAKPVTILAGFGRVINSPNKQESLQDDWSPHEIALYQSRVGELLKPAPDAQVQSSESSEEDSTMQELLSELGKVDVASDLDDYFEDPILNFDE